MSSFLGDKKRLIWPTSVSSARVLPVKALYRLHRLLGKRRAIGRPVKSSYAISHCAVNALHSL